MQDDWATGHLQTIRTLMERSAVYRRALAPITLFVGSLGVLTATVGLVFHFDSLRAFGGLWLAAAVVAVTGAFLIARRQAVQHGEPFWSPPTRRVAQALAPPLAAGMCLGLAFVVAGVTNKFALAFSWLLFYGCALHAAGFFMPRGVKLFGWIYIVLACVCLFIFAIARPEIEISAHWFMGFFFGALHLAYGAYLYLTEKGKNAT